MHCLLQGWQDNHWVEHLRMCNATFNWLLGRLLEYLMGTISRFRKPLAPDIRLGVGLYALFHTISIRTLGALFGVGTSTAHESRNIVVEAINSVLYGQVVRLPRSGAAFQTLLDGFERQGMRNCFGAVDGCHIKITNRGIPCYQDFWNYKSFLSVNIMVRSLFFWVP